MKLVFTVKEVERIDHLKHCQTINEIDKVHNMQTNSGDRSPCISCYIFYNNYTLDLHCKRETTLPKFRNEQKLEHQQIKNEYQSRIIHLHMNTLTKNKTIWHFPNLLSIHISLFHNKLSLLIILQSSLEKHNNHTLIIVIPCTPHRQFIIQKTP